MIRILEFLIAIFIVALLFFIVGVFLPSSRYVEFQMETNRPVRQVYDLLNGFKRSGDWHPLRLRDPGMALALEGPERGVGARLNFSSQTPQIGSGNWEIVDSVQDESIEFLINSPARGTDKRALIELTIKGKTVEIKWSYSVEYGWDLMGRFAGMYVSRTVGDDIKAGLGNILGLLATMPNFDYSDLEIATAEVAPQNMLFVAVESDRNITAVENAMIDSLAKLRAAIASNRLEAAGSPRLVTTNFGSDKYEFDVAIPIKHPNPGAVADSWAPAASDPTADGAGAAGSEPPPPALPLIDGLNLPEKVAQGVTYGGRVLKTEYVGHPAVLPLIRDKLRSYAGAYGEVVQDRAFEEYLTEISDTSAEDAKFLVYWPIK